MSVPLWVSITVAVIAGIFAAVIAPLITVSLNRRTWRKQRNSELKYEVFKGACAALAALTSDALDASLQRQKPAYEGVARQVEIRAETSQTLEQHRGLLAAFFSPDVVEKYGQALRISLSVKNVPNIGFDEKRLAFIKAASQELHLSKV